MEDLLTYKNLQKYATKYTIFANKNNLIFNVTMFIDYTQ